MLVKHWKKIGLIILIVLCLFNIVNKLVYKTPFEDEIASSAQLASEEEKTNSIENK